MPKGKSKTSNPIFVFKVVLAGWKTIGRRIAAGGMEGAAERNRPRATPRVLPSANENAGVSGRRWTGDAIPGGVTGFAIILHRHSSASSEGLGTNPLVKPNGHELHKPTEWK